MIHRGLRHRTGHRPDARSGVRAAEHPRSPYTYALPKLAAVCDTTIDAIVARDGSLPWDADDEAADRALIRRYSRPDADGLVSTDTGARVRPFLPSADATAVIDKACVWCDGRGYGGDAMGFSGACDACRGTGRAGRVLRGRVELDDYRDMLFFTDGHRAELMDRDICPDCGRGGCGGECFAPFALSDREMDSLAGGYW